MFAVVQSERDSVHALPNSVDAVFFFFPSFKWFLHSSARYCLLIKVLCDTFPWITPLYDGTLENRKHWKDLAEKVEMGLTWIDHDKIEIPVEEFFGESDRSGRPLVFPRRDSTVRPANFVDIIRLAHQRTKDIEFTVTTLNTTQNSTKKSNTKVSKKHGKHT